MRAVPPRLPGTEAEPRRHGGVHIPLIGYALLIGIVAGIGAIVFRTLIALFHNLMFFGRLDLHYDTLQHTPASSWGIGIIAVPVVGALIVAFLVKNFAPEARGHGVPEVIDAIYYNRGIIRPQVAVVKSLASSLSIGSGGAVGREGPIIQIGAAFGSVVSQWLRLPEWQRLVLVACGAGGGIAATFNTPVGGILFAVEIMLVEISARTLIPLMVATGAASFIGRLFFGNTPSFIIPELSLEMPATMPLSAFMIYALSGLLIGLLATVYTHAIYWFEDLFDRLPGNYYSRHAIGMALVGILMYLTMHYTGHYYIQGVGYATIQDILNGQLNATWLLLLLVGLKLLAVSLTLGSGASGGIFSPALFMGAASGAALITALNAQFSGLPLDPLSGAVIGMSCMIGAATGAAVTAVVMLFEMTRDYNAIVPTIIAVSLAYSVRHLLSAENIYTLKLSRRGHSVPSSIQSHLYLTDDALALVHAPFTRARAASTLGSLAERLDAHQRIPHVVLVEDNGHITGVIPSCVLGLALQERSPDTPLAELADERHSVVDEKTQLLDLLARLRQDRSRIALITRDGATENPEAISGVLSWADIADEANLPKNIHPLARR
ncbi:MAG TPA: chloride channel protein [Gammaproteobacteria bacterium]|nr:chloride channel protein [Gammaproteobacteria bacterium]